MKIKNKNKKTITLGEIQPGDVFKAIFNGHLYMKTAYGAPNNTVHIESGSVHAFQNEMEVIPIDCELIIK